MIVEALLAKGAGAALSALGKTKAGAEFLARLGKLKEFTNLGKAKVIEAFSDEAARLASQRIKQALRNPSLYSGAAGAELLKDYAVVAGNKINNEAVKFADFSRKMVDEFGERVKPLVEKLYRKQMTELGLGKQIDEVEIKSTRLDAIKQIPDAILDPPMARKNSRLAGEAHPVTEVPYNRVAYPIFNSEFDAELPKHLRGRSVSDYDQFKEATRQLKRKIESDQSFGNTFTRDQLADIMAEKDKIRGLTWHHHQDGVRLQLVDEWTHAKSGHDGGRKNTGGRPN